MLTSSHPPLPGILAEIEEVAGRDAAIAIQRAQGGQDVFIVAKLSDRNWLVKAVGREPAQKISDHFTSGYARQKVTIPIGESSAFTTAQRSREAAMIAAIEAGASSNAIAAAGGITSRSARRFRGRYLASLKRSNSKVR
ncbi:MULTISPECIES: hypothetical protein [Hyphomicrobiales]|uniref:hypothetical protein n=1 Tax=Methylobacterium sp. CCH7-A2 TaxID=1768789 RepID=UPI00082B9624|nr:MULTISPECIES: hypothetical protein [Hyphomicrobiales]